jgi:hypothetical protein
MPDADGIFQTGAESPKGLEMDGFTASHLQRLDGSGGVFAAALIGFSFCVARRRWE